MYVQGSTENQFTEWTPCRNITITITTSVRYLSLGSMVSASFALALAPIAIFFNLNSTYHVSKLLFILYCCSRDHAKDRVAF